ncbi:MAG: class I SAM-dependent methyltransferase [Candidatus Eremiobacteraeota bacterium]|nr:class I SAM-dependent methyltransferase [Candidatus Eremiobacteraeota bacterium]
MRKHLASRPVDRLFADAGLAALYDQFCPRGQRADFDFYIPLVMSARAVLDVGCGTGAMLNEAREAGHGGRLCGIDPAPGMLAQARKRPGIEWILGDLASTHWDREFDLVVMTGHAFQVLITDDDLRRSLAAIRSALTDDGRFVFETRNRLGRAWDDWTPENAAECTDTEGVTVRITREVVATVDDRLVTFTHTFTSPSWNQPQVSTSTLRFFDAASLLPFLVDAGLSVEEQFGDWDRTPVTATSPEIITLATKATSANVP